jgi:two-component sensor histidine kinase
MKMQRLSFFIAFIFASFSLASAQQNDIKTLRIIEDYILEQKLDSAAFVLKPFKEGKSDNYLKALERIVDDASPSYADYRWLVEKVFKSNSKSRDVRFFEFMNTIHPPKIGELNLDYVYLKWIYITRLRDIAQLDKASVENEKLEDYIYQFDENSNDYKKADLLLNIHGVVMYVIKNDLAGKSVCLENIAKAEALNALDIKAIYLSYLSIFSVIENDVDTYISTSEASLEIEKSLERPTLAYESTIEKLIDGYLFKGGKNKEALTWLLALYNSEDSRAFSYSLYANLLRNIDVLDPINQQVFEQFQVQNVIEFCDKVSKESIGVLDPNREYFVLSQSSRLLQKRGFLQEALHYMSKCLKLREKIYTDDLTSSLYNYKTEQELKQKELEITHQKDKANLYTILIVVLVSAFLIVIFVLYRVFKQTKALKIKNQQIKEQRDAIQKKEKEKALLLKEVHHRVKNNFQIVSSLLELQTRGIEDEQALKLAEEGRSRVKSMALIHQKLYQNEDLLIDFDTYIQSLVKDISTMYAKDKAPEVHVDIPNFKFDIDTAIPLGLIINELLTNTFKYGFDADHPELHIQLKKMDNEDYVLEVKDNGQGLPEGFDFDNARSLGLRLVRRLSKQLQGYTRYAFDQGASFSVTFKDTIARAAID